MGLQEGFLEVVASELKDEQALPRWKGQRRKSHEEARAQARPVTIKEYGTLRQVRNCWAIGIEHREYKGTLSFFGVQPRREMEMCQMT